MQRLSERYCEKSYEVIVVGGGMAGLCAALSSARHGAKTALIHARPMLGGNASSEIRIHISGADQSLRQSQYAESGLVYELMLANKAVNDNFSYSIWDMTLFDAAQKEKNLEVFYNTVMYDCEMDKNTIKSIMCVQETTEMRIKFSAPLFVDSTGNGTLGYYAGAEYRQGSESKYETGEPHAPERSNNERMGNTVLMKAVNTGHPVKYVAPSFAKKLTEHQLRYRMHAANQKIDSSMAPDPEEWLRLSGTSCKGVDYGYWWLELMGDGEDIITDFETIRDDLLAYAYGLWDHIKNDGDHGAENYALEWVGILPGMRESRRLMGDYVLSESDILEHRIFDDAVVYGGWCIDLHAPHGLLDFDVLPSDCQHFNGVYTVPYRSYYSKNIDNLFMAGRDISTTKLGLASTRILGCCAIGGQAVGTAAALCTKYGIKTPRELAPHIRELQQIILKDDGFLPGFRNEDEADFALKASFSASSFTNGGEPIKVIDGISRRLDGDEHGWVSDGISENGEVLTMSLPKAEVISQLRITFDSNFSYPIRVTMAKNRQVQQRIGVPAELVKDYDVILLRDGKEVAKKEIRGNFQRLNVIDFDPTECDTAEFRFHSTNGADKITVFEVRAY
ncbi:MAG: FAD-dependent oxidoreductase [Ruminococcaceae bacterium]|nr:FAD-dependent oxidoreductase [Oscillospiraceae bacterium]